MSLDYIRKTYRVPAKFGGRVVYTGTPEQAQGTIVGAKQQYVLVQMDGTDQAAPYHPTWELMYLEASNDQA